MTLLDRYVAGEMAKAFFLVMLALVSLFSFLDLIQQLDDVGSGSYGFGDAVLFELRMVAPRALSLLPFGALMGTTIALAVLCRHAEVVAARAAGVSVSRFAWAVLKSGLLLIVFAAVMDEVVVSHLQQEAERQRSLSLSGKEVTLVDGGLWIYHGNTLIHINRVLHGRIPADIDILELDAQRSVRLFIHAGQADVKNPRDWLLTDVVVKRLGESTVTSEHYPRMHWESYMTSEQISLLELRPPAMSPTQLYGYVQYLKGTGQATDRYELALWRKLTLPVATGVMVLLAIPPAFATPRSTSVGKRSVAALAVGLLFQIATQVIGDVGLIFQLSPALTTLALPIATAVAALLLMRRVVAPS
jgi:lipopolysaccharide export system permease protein